MSPKKKVERMEIPGKCLKTQGKEGKCTEMHPNARKCCNMTVNEGKQRKMNENARFKDAIPKAKKLWDPPLAWDPSTKCFGWRIYPQGKISWVPRWSIFRKHERRDSSYYDLIRGRILEEYWLFP